MPVKLNMLTDISQGALCAIQLQCRREMINDVQTASCCLLYSDVLVVNCRRFGCVSVEMRTKLLLRSQTGGKTTTLVKKFLWIVPKYVCAL